MILISTSGGVENEYKNESQKYMIWTEKNWMPAIAEDFTGGQIHLSLVWFLLPISLSKFSSILYPHNFLQNSKGFL